MVLMRLEISLICFILISSNFKKYNFKIDDSNSEFSIVLDPKPLKNAVSSASLNNFDKKPNNLVSQLSDEFNKTQFLSENSIKSLNRVDLILKSLICTAFLIICLTCILGNILVILSVFTYRPLQSVQNIFIVSLALADTFVAIFVMPFHVSYFLNNGKWLFGTFVCHFFLTLDILLCTSSILHLCCIALDRYWAIKDSIKYAQKRTFKRVMIMIFIAWLLSAVISLPVIIWNMKTVRSTQTDVSLNSDYISHLDYFNSSTLKNEIVCDIPHDKLYRFYSSSGTFFVPLLIMTFVYVRIYLETKRRLHERAKAAKKLAKSMANSSSVQSTKEKKRKIFTFKCLCCYEKERKMVKSSEQTGAYLNEESNCDYKNREESVYILNRDSQKSEKYDDKKENKNFNNLVNKVSIGINTINENQNDKMSERKNSKKIEFLESRKINSQQNNSTTWTRNAINSGTTLKQRQKISLTRERRAARTLGIIMGAFTICWFPFFIVYLLQSFDYFTNGYGLFEFLTWLGYVNSALNPIIYTIFNIDFRKSFERILFKCILCKRR
ncbi:unnamed protein product [Brachionus calyciflorus]|uniref:G-protein coupled receptors family 1 profile domain-containing protein n=1 Tax=Brachionus calyciflorus TaxID=104777 RepID=A0A813NA82_9BILA|nr:unnamed protein product [Brachionus calyciflorus]